MRVETKPDIGIYVEGGFTSNGPHLENLKASLEDLNFTYIEIQNHFVNAPLLDTIIWPVLETSMQNSGTTLFRIS